MRVENNFSSRPLKCGRNQLGFARGWRALDDYVSLEAITLRLDDVLASQEIIAVLETHYLLTDPACLIDAEDSNFEVRPSKYAVFFFCR